MYKRIGLLLLLVALCSCGTSSTGSATTDPIIPQLTTETGWWIDTTNSVAPETLLQLKAESDALQAKGYALGGVFFSNSVSEPLDICTKFGNENGVRQGKNNGIAICVFTDKAGKDLNPPAIAIAVGTDLEKAISDGRAKRFIDEYYIPLKQDGEWQKGVVEMTRAVHRYLDDPENAEFADKPLDPWVVVLLVIGLILLVILVCLDGAYNGFEITTGVVSAIGQGVGGFGGSGASG